MRGGQEEVKGRSMGGQGEIKGKIRLGLGRDTIRYANARKMGCASKGCSKNHTHLSVWSWGQAPATPTLANNVARP